MRRSGTPGRRFQPEPDVPSCKSHACQRKADHYGQLKKAKDAGLLIA